MRLALGKSYGHQRICLPRKEEAREPVAMLPVLRRRRQRERLEERLAALNPAPYRETDNAECLCHVPQALPPWPPKMDASCQPPHREPAHNTRGRHGLVAAVPKPVPLPQHLFGQLVSLQ